MSVLASTAEGWILSHEKSTILDVSNANGLEDSAQQLFNLTSNLFNISEPYKCSKKTKRNPSEIKLQADSQDKGEGSPRLNADDDQLAPDALVVKALFEKILGGVDGSLTITLSHDNLSPSKRREHEPSAIIEAETFFDLVKDVEFSQPFVENNSGRVGFKKILFDKVGNFHTFLVPQESRVYCDDVKNFGEYFNEKEFSLIIIDPPWRNKYIRRRKRKHAEAGYQMMEAEDLHKLPVGFVAKENALIAVWCTNSKKCQERLVNTVFPSWGVQFLSKWFWLKVTSKLAPVCPFNEDTKKQPFEVIILGRRKFSSDGAEPASSSAFTESITWDNKLIVSTPSAINSHKPPLLEILRPFVSEVDLSSANCCEIFARYALPGFTSYGNEVLKLMHESLYVELSLSDEVTPTQNSGINNTPPPLYVQVFSNDVILRRLTHYLGFVDLKILRQVNQKMNQIILEVSNFLSRSTIILDKDSMRHPLLKTLSFIPPDVQLHPYVIRDVDYDGVNQESQTREITENVGDIVQNCECLTVSDKEDRFSSRSIRSDISSTNFDNVDLPPLCPNVLKVVLRGICMKHIVLHEAASLFLCRSTEEQGRLLSKLKHIEYHCSWRGIYLPPLLAGVTGLETFCVVGEGYSSDFSENSEGERNRWAKILDNNIDSFTKLGFGIEISNYSGGAFTNRIFKNLKSIELVIYENFNLVLDILTAHKANLEEIRLTCFIGPRNREDFEPVLNLICINVPNLKVLEMEMSHFRIVTESFPRIFSALNLRDLVLKNSSVCDNVPSAIRYIDILSSIPNSLRKLTLNGELGNDACFTLNSAKLPNFVQMTALELISMEGVSDEFVQGIIRNLIHLRRLKISEIQEITEKAFIAPQRASTGHNDLAHVPTLRNLQRLEDLSLCHLSAACSSSVVLREISFPGLRKLKLLGTAMTNSTLKLLLTKNLSLERLHSDMPQEQVLQTLQSLYQSGVMFASVKYYNNLRLPPLPVTS